MDVTPRVVKILQDNHRVDAPYVIKLTHELRYYRHKLALLMDYDYERVKYLELQLREKIMYLELEIAAEVSLN